MIEVRGLTKRYGSALAVNDLSFAVRPGVVTEFSRAERHRQVHHDAADPGAGQPHGGAALVNGRPHRQLNSPMCQIGALLDAKTVHGGRSARSHLLCLAQTNGIPRRRVEVVLGIVGLSDVARKRATGFSLSISQRLGISAALLEDPQVPMFDEPVNGLDPEGVRRGPAWHDDTRS